MAHPDWPFMGANHQWDLGQVWRFPIHAEAAKNGVALAKMWYGGYPTRPSRINDYAAVVTEWKTALPGLRDMRQLFNQFQFTGANGGYFDSDSEVFIQSLAQHGYRNLWVLMDGPSQRNYAGVYGNASNPVEPGIDSRQGTVPGTKYWDHYYDRALIDADPVGSAPAAMAHIHESQMLAWTRLLAYLKANPNIYDTTIGFELINEPASYADLGSKIKNNVTALTYYVQHCLDIVALIDREFPNNGHDIYVGGWAYSATSNIFHQTHLPSYGKTAYEVLRDAIGADRFVWSIHMYPSWTGGVPTTPAQLESWANGRFGDSIRAGDRIAITEINAQNSHFNNTSYASHEIRKGFLWSRNPDFFRRNNISIFWWPLASWAAGSVMDSRGTGIQADHQNSMAAFVNVLSHGNRTAWFSGPDSGYRDATFVECTRGVLNEPTDPDYADRGDLDPVDGYALGFGGRGVAVVRPVETANNYLYGGDGYNVLYGSEVNDDWLSLGRGGGVIRLFGGYSYANTNGGLNRIYGGSQWCLITCYHGRNTIIVDPVAETTIMGFNPGRGDKISFKGAFASMVPLRMASTALADPGNLAGEIDLYVDFPQGGRLRMVGSASLIDSLHRSCLDLTDGWYASGWTEPVDFSETQFSDPIVPPPDLEQNTLSGLPRGLRGVVVRVFDYKGNELTLARR